MGKRAVCVFILFTVLSFGLNFISNAFGQPENVRVLSYSWYVDSIGYFVVVGEIQNIGSDTIDSVILSGTVYTIDGTPQSESYTQAFVRYLVPQQKAPFYMEFPSTSGDLSWLSLGLERVDFVVNQANATASYQYPHLVIKVNSAVVAADGVYWVSGTVQNTGTQTARNIRVIGTFYNASGSVVGVGYTNVLDPASFGPSGTAPFRVGAFDLNQTEVPSRLRISSYALLVQTEGPILLGTPPFSFPSTGSTNSSSSDSAVADQTTSFSLQLLSVAVVAVVIVGIAGISLALRKRRFAPVRKRKSKPYRIRN